jgi:hypothetical protein
MAWESEFCSIPDGGEVICWDLDSTLRSTMHRRHLIPEIRAGRATWDDYSLLAGDDEPIEGAVALLRVLENQAWNIAVSGCADSALDITRGWAHLHDVLLDDYLLRPAGDRTPNGEWKVAAVRRLQAAGLKVRLFVEDWGPAAKYIREHAGVPVLGVNPFDEGTITVSRADLVQALAHSGGYGVGNCGTQCADGVFSYLEDKLCL